MATTSKEGSRRANYPILTQGGSDKNEQGRAFHRSDHWNEGGLHLHPRIHWRASLVPAAAVIPAPRAYMQVAAVEKLVVGFRVSELGSPLGSLPVVCCPAQPSEGPITL